jgi:hypothetical protein
VTPSDHGDIEDVDARSARRDEAALALAAELVDRLPGTYELVEGHRDAHGSVSSGGMQIRPGATIGAVRFIARNPIGEEFIVTVEMRF